MQDQILYSIPHNIFSPIWESDLAHSQIIVCPFELLGPKNSIIAAVCRSAAIMEYWSATHDVSAWDCLLMLVFEYLSAVYLRGEPGERLINPTAIHAPNRPTERPRR